MDCVKGAAIIPPLIVPVPEICPPLSKRNMVEAAIFQVPLMVVSFEITISLVLPYEVDTVSIFSMIVFLQDAIINTNKSIPITVACFKISDWFFD